MACARDDPGSAYTEKILSVKTVPFLWREREYVQGEFSEKKVPSSEPAIPELRPEPSRSLSISHDNRRPNSRPSAPGFLPAPDNNFAFRYRDESESVDREKPLHYPLPPSGNI